MYTIMFDSLPSVFARVAFDFHVMPEKFHWKEHVNGLAIFKQHLDSLIPALWVTIHFTPYI